MRTKSRSYNYLMSFIKPFKISIDTDRQVVCLQYRLVKLLKFQLQFIRHSIGVYDKY